MQYWETPVSTSIKIGKTSDTPQSNSKSQYLKWPSQYQIHTFQSSKKILIIALFVGFQAFSPHWDGAQYNPSDPTNRKEALGKSFTDSGRLSKRKHRDVIPQLWWQSCKKEQLRKNCHLCGVTESLTPWLMWPCCVEMLSSRDQSLLLLNWIVGFVKVVTWIW